MAEKLKRTIFEQSREMEFFTKKELAMQIGYDEEWWPIALLRELTDNSLDACETKDISPDITIEVDRQSFSVTDNGVGIPSRLIQKAQDYMIRISDKSFYVSPTRGQMGNAMKVILAAPFVMDGENGVVETWSKGVHHVIEAYLDRISQKPRFNHTQNPDGFVKNGTKFKIHLKNSASLISVKNADFYNPPFTVSDILDAYSLFNPHATFHYNERTYKATDTGFHKWRVDDQTSPFWYTPETLRSLIGAYISREINGGKALTVREFVSEFRGLSSTVKQKHVTEGLSGVYLHDLVKDGRDIDIEILQRLLEKMKTEAKPVKPSLLGVIGEKHLRKKLVDLGCAEDSIAYAKRQGDDGLPFVMEFCFGVKENSEERRRIITGLNFSPTLKPSSYEVDEAVQHMRIDPGDPVVLVVHLVKPRFEFVDRGKTRVTLSSDMYRDVFSGIASVAKKWKKAKRQADREDRLSQRQINEMRRRPPRVTIRQVVYDELPNAYKIVSDDGRYHANARQLFYQVRPQVIERTGEPWNNSSYFTQTLLKDYIEEYSPDWRVVWDARGHIREPHTNKVIGLGGAEVGEYIRNWNSFIDVFPDARFSSGIGTTGPEIRYSSVLFIEKEGFNEVLDESGISEEFDLGIMSTKGVPVGASCKLAHMLHSKGVQVFVLHDFDFAGFKIVNTLRTGTRLAPGTPDVVDIGLRLDDVEGLQYEDVEYKQSADPRRMLRKYGATESEQDFLVQNNGGYHHYSGKRVELNVLTSSQFVDFIRRKLQERKVMKLIPGDRVLSEAYKRAVYCQRINEKIEEIKGDVDREIVVPPGLRALVEKKIQKSRRAWDDVLWYIAEGGMD
jgi:DNA topoisomerase VI subunit B